MRLKASPAAGAIILTVVLGLSACGGSDSGTANGDTGSSVNDEAAVREVSTKLQQASRDGDAAKFCSLFEPSRLDAWIGNKRCIKIFKPALKQASDRKIEVETIDIDGETATVKFNVGETKFKKFDGKWYVETPDLEAQAPQKD